NVVNCSEMQQNPSLIETLGITKLRAVMQILCRTELLTYSRQNAFRRKGYQNPALIHFRRIKVAVNAVIPPAVEIDVTFSCKLRAWIFLQRSVSHVSPRRQLHTGVRLISFFQNL